jgi:hypothetical protein
MQQQNNNNNNNGGGNKPNFELRFKGWRVNEKTGKPKWEKAGGVYIQDANGNLVDPRTFNYRIKINFNWGGSMNVFAPYDPTAHAGQQMHQAQQNQNPQPHQQSPHQQGNQQQNFGQQNNFPDGNYEPVGTPYDDFSHGR